MKKKATIAITLILISIFLLACTSENKEKTPDEQVWDIGLEIYEGLKNKDKEKIKSVFSENELMNHSRKIDNKIDEILEQMDTKETYTTYKVYIVRENDSLETIIEKYLNETENN